MICKRCGSPRLSLNGKRPSKEVKQIVLCKDCGHRFSFPLGAYTQDTPKTLVVVADTHCGHHFGLTPPQWQWIESEEFDEYHNTVAKFHKLAWSWYSKVTSKLPTADLLLLNADLIDGRGEKSGGTELISTSRLEQCNMAKDVIRQVKTKSYKFTYGTPYHVGSSEDYEGIIANDFGGDIKDEQDFIMNGALINAKHNIGGGSSVMTRGTQIAKPLVWNMVKEYMFDRDKTDLVIRSHAHTKSLLQMWGKTGIITPAMQLGSKYGRRLDGYTDFGLTVITIKDKSDIKVRFLCPPNDYFKECFSKIDVI